MGGALQSAAGVAGGVLLADSIRNLFGGHAGGWGGLGTGSGVTGLGGGETIVNNYHDDGGTLTDNSHTSDDVYDVSDNSSDSGNSDDGSFDV